MKKTKNQDSYKITPREFQRGIFLASLRQQLNKVADAHSKIITAAREYSRDGLDETEVRELLLIDGYNHELVASAMERLAEEGDAGEQWGFELSDVSGRTLTHEDLSVEASSESEIRALAEQMVAEGSADRIVRIFRIG